jgi:hypothetical protein
MSGMLLGVLTLTGTYWYQRKVKKSVNGKLEVRLERTESLREELRNI